MPDHDTPKRLTEWIRGTLTLHFAGATVSRRMSLADALDIESMLDQKRSSDRIDWAALNWMQFASEKVLVCEFTADEDLGWRLCPEERDTLASGGHSHGILHTLRAHWAAKGREPRYTALALSTLSRIALQGLSAQQFADIADLIEGADGHDLVDQVLDQAAARERRVKVEPDDSAEPDAARPDHPTSDRSHSDQPDATERTSTQQRPSGSDDAIGDQPDTEGTPRADVTEEPTEEPTEGNADRPTAGPEPS